MASVSNPQKCHLRQHTSLSIGTTVGCVELCTNSSLGCGDFVLVSQCLSSRCTQQNSACRCACSAFFSVNIDRSWVAKRSTRPQAQPCLLGRSKRRKKTTSWISPRPSSYPPPSENLVRQLSLGLVQQVEFGLRDTGGALCLTCALPPQRIGVVDRLPREAGSGVWHQLEEALLRAQ